MRSGGRRIEQEEVQQREALESILRCSTNIPMDEPTEAFEKARMQDFGPNGQKLLMGYSTIRKGNVSHPSNCSRSIVKD